MEKHEHDHNGTYVRRPECELQREKFDIKLEAIKNTQWLILTFQIITVGGAVIKWVIG